MLNAFYQDLLPQDDTYKLVWTLNNKRSHWFKNINSMVQFIQHHKEDVYYGLGTTDKKLPSYKRALNSQITSIRALHLDIDLYSSIAHKHNDKLPQTIEEGLEIANSILAPTYVVDSGYGLHAYYLLYEHTTIDNYEWWSLFFQAFQIAHREANLGYKIDSTHDFARVLRCPGSINCKDPENPRECKIIHYDDSCYYTTVEIEDAIDFDPDKIIAIQNAEGVEEADAGGVEFEKLNRRLSSSEAHQFLSENNLVLDRTRTLSSEDFIELQSSASTFIDEYKNTKKPPRDSGSEYEMALANIAARAGYSDQKILDLMISHRVYNNHPTDKLDPRRADYWVNTLLKAKKASRLEQVSKRPHEKITRDDKEEIRSYLETKLGISIKRLVRYKRSPTLHFEIELTTHPGISIPLGSSYEGIMNQNNFASKILDHTKIVPNEIKKAVWRRDIINKLMALTEDGVSSKTATYEGQVREWSREFFENKSCLESLEHFVENNSPAAPFFHNDRVYFQLEALIQWIRNNKGINADIFHFSITMTKNGFIQDTVKGVAGRRISLWATPLGFIQYNGDENQ